MKVEDAREAMYQRWDAEWADRTQFVLGNEPAIDAQEAPWARMSVSFEDRAQTSLGRKGSRKFESYGRVFIQLFAAKGAAMEALDQLTDAALPIFDSLRIAGTTIRFNAAKSREIGMDQANRYYQVLIEAPFVIEAQG